MFVIVVISIFVFVSILFYIGYAKIRYHDRFDKDGNDRDIEYDVKEFQKSLNKQQ